MTSEIRYYVDSESGDDSASGLRPEEAWKSLERPNSVKFPPGGRISFKRGTSYEGTFAPQGCGTEEAPITVCAYGEGAKPKINGNGALAGVLLHNVDYWEVRDLDVSNHGAIPPRDDEVRIGLYVLIEDYGTGHHYVIENLDIHDVNGGDCRNPHTKDVSGGIVFKAGGTTLPTSFDGVEIRGNTIRRADRQGIAISSDWERRAQYTGGRGTEYAANLGVHIAGNHGEDLGGDAVAVCNALNAVIEHNTFRGWAERAPSFTAGLSAFNSDGTVFRHNEVSYGRGHGALPSAAFMTEHANLDTVFEYNFTRENQGGMLVVCSDAGRPTDRTIVRHNISQNDNSDGWLPNCPDGIAQMGVITVVCLESGRVDIHNNTIHTTVAERMLMNHTENRLNFRDNVFIGRPDGSALQDPIGVYDHNLYVGITNPPGSDEHALTGDVPLLAPGKATGLDDLDGYRRATGSPAIGADLYEEGA